MQFQHYKLSCIPITEASQLNIDIYRLISYRLVTLHCLNHGPFDQLHSPPTLWDRVSYSRACSHSSDSCIFCTCSLLFSVRIYMHFRLTTSTTFTPASVCLLPSGHSPALPLGFVQSAHCYGRHHYRDHEHCHCWHCWQTEKQQQLVYLQQIVYSRLYFLQADRLIERESNRIQSA